MRGIYSSVTDIRRQVFTEVARMAYEGGDYSRVEELPYKILPGEVSKYRDSIFLERAIVGAPSTSTRPFPPVSRRPPGRRNTTSRPSSISSNSPATPARKNLFT